MTSPSLIAILSFTAQAQQASIFSRVAAQSLLVSGEVDQQLSLLCKDVIQSAHLEPQPVVATSHQLAISYGVWS